jgi:hypothetical protein
MSRPALRRCFTIENSNTLCSRQRASHACAGLDQLAGQNHCIPVERYRPSAASRPVDRGAQADIFAGYGATTRRASAARRPDLLSVITQRRVVPAQREERIGQFLHDRHSKGAHVAAARLPRTIRHAGRGGPTVQVRRIPHRVWRGRKLADGCERRCPRVRTRRRRSAVSGL